MATADWKTAAEAMRDSIRREALAWKPPLREFARRIDSVPIPEQPEAEGREAGEHRECASIVRRLVAYLETWHPTDLDKGAAIAVTIRNAHAFLLTLAPPPSSKSPRPCQHPHCDGELHYTIHDAPPSTRIEGPCPSSKSLLSEGDAGGETLAWTPRMNEGGNPEPSIAAEGSGRPEAKGAPIAPSATLKDGVAPALGPMHHIGASVWPGLSKLIEEAGEVQQVCGKIIALGGAGDLHWDGSNLRERLSEELADVQAAIDFVVNANGLDNEWINERTDEKREKFEAWHEKQRAAALHPEQQSQSPAAAPEHAHVFDSQLLCKVCGGCAFDLAEEAAAPPVAALVGLSEEGGE